MMIKMILQIFYNYNEYEFTQLASIKKDSTDSCNNQILIFHYFNEIELNNLSNRIESFFIEIPDVISQLIDKNPNSLSIVNLRKSRFVIGIKNENNSINYIDLYKLFHCNNIKRTQNSMVSLIYSSLDEDEKDVSTKNSILSHIQCEVFKIDNKEQIRFIIKSNDSLFCVNNNKIFVFSIQIAFIKYISIYVINSIELNESKVSLLTQNKDIGQIDIQFVNEEIAKIFISFLNS